MPASLKALFLLLYTPVTFPRAYSVTPATVGWHRSSSSGRSYSVGLHATSASIGQDGTTAALIMTLASKIEACIAANQDPEELLCRLEELNAVKEPNRSPAFLGEWHVWYTNCPPPSNGQLGPFQGSAGQVIDASAFESGAPSYQNLLKVPPNDWLTATLDGIWEDWDGVYLNNIRDDSDTALIASPDEDPVGKSKDWGADHWKVTFLRLTIAVFGFPLVKKEFPPGTARIWRTTYLDDEIRIVRAGKTGRLTDEVVFYTKRTVPPTR